MSKVKDLTGQRFGRLKVLRFVGVNALRKAVWACTCDCGALHPAVGSSLLRGHTRSCGCLVKDMHLTHGATGTTTHRTWLAMRARCNNPKHADYPNYGGRGIKVCARWRAFENFLADMGERPKGMSIERRKVNGNYTPRNCEWATPQQQSSNRRNTIQLTANGERLPLVTWAARLAIPTGTLRTRLRYGWSEQRVCTTPALIVRKRGPRGAL